MHPSQIIIPDFDFYARDFHASLIRQNRLAVGLNALAELDRNMQQMVAHERQERQRTAAHQSVTVVAEGVAGVVLFVQREAFQCLMFDRVSCPVQLADISWEFRPLWQEGLRRSGPPVSDPCINMQKSEGRS